MKRWIYVALGAGIVFAIAGVAVGTAFAIEDRRDYNRRVSICEQSFDRQVHVDECVARLAD